MGVSVEVWRSRIGTYNRSGLRPSFSMMLFPPLLQVFHFLILLMLLVIGNVELNPGPNLDLKKCKLCTFQAISISQHLKHHEGNFNYIYECPFEYCLLTFKSFPNLDAHVSHHGAPRDAVVSDAIPLLPELQFVLCSQCFTSTKVLVKHMMDHSKVGTAVSCPLSNEC